MFKKTLLGIFLLLWLVLAINPTHAGVWAMENLIVVVMFPVVLWLDRNYKFTNTTFLLLTIFAVLHLFGAHYTYEKMIHFQWFSDWLGLERNYYDQVVHFLSGLLVFMTFFEIYYHQGHTRNLSYLMGFLYISAISAWYEVLEWLAMLVFCREPNCDQFVTQGDVWDTQKDMAYAAIGAVVALLLHRFFSKVGSAPGAGRDNGVNRE